MYVYTCINMLNCQSHPDIIFRMADEAQSQEGKERDSEVTTFSKGAYFLGKGVWGKVHFHISLASPSAPQRRKLRKKQRAA